MTVTKWETHRASFETRVSLPTSVGEIRLALDDIEFHRDGFGDEPITVSLEDAAIVFSFPTGEVSSVGRER
jgi:hypothetical protein